MKPFLRWVGGKTSLAPLLANLAQAAENRGTYWEPFAGACSVFFRLLPERSVLADLNADLIWCYKAVRERPELVSRYLRELASQTTEKDYYAVRAKYNTASCTFSKAAMFVYLNKTCFNGIWRVNRKGEFNVPYGRKDRPALPSREELEDASRALRSTEIQEADFREVVAKASPGDFVYFDPPYPPLNGTSYFTHYTAGRFAEGEHKDVAKAARSLAEMGCDVMVTNADLPEIRKLYRGLDLYAHAVRRSVHSGGKRHRASELIALSFSIPREILAAADLEKV